MKVTLIPIVIGILGSHQRTRIGTGGLGNSRDYPNNSTFEIGQNTEKSPGDLSRQTIDKPVRNIG